MTHMYIAVLRDEGSTTTIALTETESHVRALVDECMASLQAEYGPLSWIGGGNPDYVVDLVCITPGHDALDISAFKREIDQIGGGLL